MARTHQHIARTSGWREQQFAITWGTGYNIKISELTEDNVKLRDGYVKGAWGIHREGREWRLTHLPTGLGIPYCTSSLVKTFALVDDLDALYDDWRGLTIHAWLEVREELSEAIREVARQHDASRIYLGGTVRAG